MTVKDSGYYFPGEFKATETLFKEVFLAFLAVLTSKDLFSYSIKQKNINNNNNQKENFKF